MASVRGMGVAVMMSWCGRRPCFCALLPQRHALLHAEAVLLVDDDQRQAREVDALLEQRMRADGDAAPRPRRSPPGRCAARARAASRTPGATVSPSGMEPVARLRQCCSASSSVGRHERGLEAAARRARRGRRRHHGLAAADVALHQPHHRHAGDEVALGIAQRALLRAGEGERQPGEEALRESRLVRQCPGRVGLERALAHLQRTGDAPAVPRRPGAAGPGGCPAGQFRELRLARRAVQVADRAAPASGSLSGSRPPAGSSPAGALRSSSRSASPISARRRPCGTPVGERDRWA